MGYSRAHVILRNKKRRQFLSYIFFKRAQNPCLRVNCQTTKTTPTSPYHYLLPKIQEENGALLPGCVKGVLPLWVRLTRKKHVRNWVGCREVLFTQNWVVILFPQTLPSYCPGRGTCPVSKNFTGTFPFYPKRRRRYMLSHFPLYRWEN